MQDNERTMKQHQEEKYTMHLEDPYAHLYDTRGNLLPCYEVNGSMDLSFDHNKHIRKKGQASKIPNMTIGDVRQCFMQLRLMKKTVTSKTHLWNGMQAGEFAILYIIKTYKHKCKHKKVQPGPKKKRVAKSAI
jgi:hypothetical protein